MNDLFLRACRREHVERTPVWMMRQAGRYLPEYRAVRAKNGFLAMCKTPEIVAEVTIQPVDLVGVDAAIIFSDILIIPEAMGMRLDMVESRGPILHDPVRTRGAVEALRIADPERALKFLPDAIALTRRMLGGRVPLIGFAGSPWTLACYMVEGGATRDFRNIKRMMLDEPQTLQLLLQKLTHSVQLLLEAQMAAGADAVQIFDSWGGTLSPDHFRKWSLDPIFGVLNNLRKAGKPVIVFCKGANQTLKEISEVGADVVGLDWTVDIGDVRGLVGDRVALQGNLDPAALYASPEVIRHEVKAILRKYGEGPGHIFNLGHGITPDVPVEHARAMIRAVKEESGVFHGS